MTELFFKLGSIYVQTVAKDLLSPRKISELAIDWANAYVSKMNQVLLLLLFKERLKKYQAEMS